jgi:hypothetical protein
MSVITKIQAQSIKGTNFTIELEVSQNGMVHLVDTAKGVHRWNWGTSYWYKQNPTIRELLFVLNFLQKNRLKLVQISSYDLAELITQLLELENRKSSTGNPSKRSISRKHSKKALLYTHAIMDLAVKLKEI